MGGRIGEHTDRSINKYRYRYHKKSLIYVNGYESYNKYI